MMFSISFADVFLRLILEMGLGGPFDE